MKKIILYICILFSLACQNEKKDIRIVKYFDAEVYVQNEIVELSAKKIKANKVISLNGEKEFLKGIAVDSAFLYNEFKLFSDANINKPALLGKYRIDTFWFIDPISLEDQQGLSYFKIDNSDTKLKTTNIELYSENIEDANASFSMRLESDNFMHSYYKRIHYRKGEMLFVKAWEKTLFQDTLFYETKITFEKN